MSEWTSEDNPFIDESRSYSSAFKPLPLPDDIIGFDTLGEPTIAPGTIMKQQERNCCTLPSTTAPQAEDLETILFDLGISDGYQRQRTPQPEKPEKHHVKGHSRKISGSGIFGFVGMGADTQLSIPGMPSDTVPVPMENRKPVYQDVVKFDNLDFTRSHSQPQIRDQEIDPDFYMTAGSKYKFPGPNGNGNGSAATGSYSAQDLRALRKYQPFEGYESASQTPEKPSTPLKNVSSSPTKEVTSVDDIRKLMTNHPDPSSESASTPVFTSPRKSVADSVSGDTSAFSTPLKVRNTFMNVKTPSPTKPPATLNWIPTLITKKNDISEKILKEQSRSPTKKKKPTIKSTLATGTLDKYFIGPDEHKVYTCKYEECNKTFTRISNIRAHIQTHLCDRPFVCPVCKRAFVRNHDLRRHYKGHEEYKFVCPCGKKFPRQDALKRHRVRNICVGGIPDENGILKKHKNCKGHQHATKRGGRPKKKDALATQKIVGRLDEQLANITPGQVEWPQQYSTSTKYVTGKRATTVVTATANAFDPFQRDPANSFFDNGIDLSMDYSFNLEDITSV